MRFISFFDAGQTRTGIVVGDRAIDLTDLAIGDTQSLLDIIQGGAHQLTAIESALSTAARRPLASLCLLPPVPTAGKNIFCIGRNYLGHVEEGYRARGKAVDVPQAPQIFSKPRTTLAAAGEELRFTKAVSDRMDYEGELGIVIGKGGRDIAPEAAFDYIFGYTIINDVTARDLQRKHDQWFKGKGLDQSCPMGPWIVTKDEIENIQAVGITTTVNGEVRQSAKVSQMIFDIPTILAELSKGMTLEPGDVIASGTPEGVGYAMATPHYLANGDVVTVAIDGIGELTNRIAMG